MYVGLELIYPWVFIEYELCWVWRLYENHGNLTTGGVMHKRALNRINISSRIMEALPRGLVERAIFEVE